MLSIPILIVLFLLILGFPEYSSQSTNSSGSISTWSSLLGNSLYKWNNTDQELSIIEYPTEKLIENNVIGVYFSASWCNPCKQFTPQLVKFYNEMKKKGKKFEIVWVSQDRNTDDYVSYFQEMPWLAVPPENVRNVLAVLNNPTEHGKDFKLKGIPHLVILSNDAEIYTVDGRNKVNQDKYGLEFPWAPRGIHQLIPKQIRKAASNFLSGILESIAPRKLLIRFKEYSKKSMVKLLSSFTNTLKINTNKLISYIKRRVLVYANRIGLHL